LKILITGATGFIGSHLVRKLAKEGHKVCVLVRPASNLWRLEEIKGQVEILSSEISEFEFENFKTQLKDVEIIYHLAAAGVNQDINSTSQILNSNIIGTLKILQAAVTLKVTQFIYCGSCFEYGSGKLIKETCMPAPNSEYSASKTSGWFLTNAFHQRYGLPVFSVRPFTVFGPYESRYRFVPHVIMKSIKNEEIELTSGEQTRDFIYVEDVIRGFLAILNRPGLEGKTTNLSTGKETAIKYLAAIIANYFGSEHLLRFGALPYRQTEIWNLSGDPTNAKSILGWKAKTELADGIEKTITWFEKHHPKFGEYTK
jgi:nucleoside-diphosphate-sugar epimerase